MDVNCNNAVDINVKPEEPVQQNSIQLRTSARVLKKQKLDQEIAEKAEETSDSTGDVHPPAPVAPVAPQPSTPTAPKKRAAPIQWSPHEKVLFFEALNDYGKDFDAIEKLLTSRAKKKPDGSLAHPVKTRVQVKSFYRRMFHKLSKYITLPETVKKIVQELYMLINFGELRKRISHLTERNSVKLKELIYCGSTQVREKGKTWRIKTPVCMALKKLNQIKDGCGDEVRLPSRVEVLLTPRENRDRSRVESLGLNPRLKTTLGLDMALSSLISYLNCRWTFTPQLSTRDDWETKKLKVHVGPKRDTPLVQTYYKCGQQVTSSCISLLSYQVKQGTPLGSLQKLIGLVPPNGVRANRLWARWHHEGEPVVDKFVNKELVEPVLFSSDEADLETPLRESKEEFDSRIRNGWTADTSMRTRIADLYLIFGSNCKLELDYWWDETDLTEETSLSLSKLLTLARLWTSKSHKEYWSQPAPAPSVQTKSPSPPPSNCLQNVTQPSSFIPTNPTQVEVKTEVAEETQTTLVLVSNPPVIQGRFRQPLLPAPSVKRTLTSEVSNPLQLRPKYCNRRGRYRPKNVVVQRMLPLLPKTNSTPSCTLVTLQVVAGGPSASGDFVPNTLPLNTSTPLKKGTEGSEASSSSSPVKEEAAGSAVLSDLRPAGEKPLDSPLLCHEPLVFLNSPQPEDKPNSFSGLLGGGSSETVVSTPPTSPTRLLNDGESHWLSSEVADFSLSSFLGHLESPLKSNGVLPPIEDTRMSADVESHLQSMMMETSLDYTAKFADLAAKIAGTANQPTTSNIAPSQP